MQDCDGEYDDPPNLVTDNDGMHETGSPIADVIKAALTPSDKGAETLRSVGTSEAQEQLRQIGQIVCG